MNQCNICRRSYVWPHYLKIHMKLKHKSDQHQGNTICSKQQQQQQFFYPPQHKQQVTYFPSSSRISIHLNNSSRLSLYLPSSSSSSSNSSKTFNSNITLLQAYQDLPHVEKLTLSNNYTPHHVKQYHKIYPTARISWTRKDFIK